MNNPNPFVPKGSLLEQQNLRRSRLKLAVFCVLAVSVTGLVAMLIQGCKRENPDASNPSAGSSQPTLDLTNMTSPMMTPDTNVPAAMAAPAPATNAVVTPPPMPVTPPPAPVEPAAGTEYVVVKGDTLAKIAKDHGVSVHALEAANPGVDAKKLKIGKKLTIPASTKSAEAAPAAAASSADGGGEVYVVKSGDTLTHIAKKHGITTKTLKAANSLTTDRINVGQKLKLPAKTEAAAPAPVPEPAAAPVTPPASTPAK